MGSKMKVHCFTLNWNGKDKLEKLRCGLMKNFSYISMRAGRPITSLDNYPTWHVRDNASIDDSVYYLNSCAGKSDFPYEIIAYEIGHNRDNFAQGMNYLFEQANPGDDDLILFLNNDVEFQDSKSLHNMIELHKQTGADVVGARLLYPETNKLQHSGIIFGKRYNAMPYHFKHKEESDASAQQNRYFQAVTAAVMLVTAKSFRTVGGFDTGFNWAFDDVDLVLRINNLKQNNIAYCGQTNIWHAESASLKKNPINQLFLQKNVALFRQKWSGKYDLDHEKYLQDTGYRVIRAQEKTKIH